MLTNIVRAKKMQKIIKRIVKRNKNLLKMTKNYKKMHKSGYGARYHNPNKIIPHFNQLSPKFIYIMSCKVV